MSKFFFKTVKRTKISKTFIGKEIDLQFLAESEVLNLKYDPEKTNHCTIKYKEISYNIYPSGTVLAFGLKNNFQQEKVFEELFNKFLKKYLKKEEKKNGFRSFV